MLYYVQYIFYLIPLAALVCFIISLCRYVSGRRQGLDAAEMKMRKMLLIVSAAVAGVLLAVIIALAVLLYTAVAFM